MQGPRLRALVTGATGTIGTRLVARLGGARVLARDPDAARRTLAAHAEVEVVRWSAGATTPADAFDGIDAVFHLAGEPVAGERWTAAKKTRIRASRVDGTRSIVSSMARASRPPPVLVSASAVGIYGSRGDEVLTEASSPAVGFLADVCRAWEAESHGARALGVRVVNARIGIVLERSSGALGAMIPAFRFGVGGPLGDGSQWMPWVHVDDVVGLLVHAALEPSVDGPMNVCAPMPVPNREFARMIGAALGRPSIVRAPAFALRLAVGEMADVALASQRVLPEVATRSGYTFAFPHLESALADVLGSRAVRVEEARA